MTFYDPAREAASDVMEKLLEGCDQSIEPLEGDEATCVVCGAPPDARHVWRKGGTEMMAWAAVCADHHDTELRVTAS